MLHVITVLDGRPGHEKQTQGIIAGLRRRVAVKLIRVDLRRHTFFDRCIANFQLLFPYTAPLRKEFMQADLIIGAGSKTHAVALAIKRKYSIPACTCMTPSPFLRGFFDCCFVPEHDCTPEGKNIFYTLGAPNCSIDKKRHDSRLGLILLGGIDSSSHYWESEKIVDMVKTVIDKDSNKSWTISSSPRTPQDTIDKINLITEDYDNVSFFHFKDTPGGWVEKQYDRCETVWVTSDSISMIFEALSAGCKVHIFPMEWKRQKNKFKRNEDILVEGGRVRSYVDWMSRCNDENCKIKLNEAQRCADHILKKWWPKSLL